VKYLWRLLLWFVLVELLRSRIVVLLMIIFIELRPLLLLRSVLLLLLIRSLLVLILMLRFLLKLVRWPLLLRWFRWRWRIGFGLGVFQKASDKTADVWFVWVWFFVVLLSARLVAKAIKSSACIVRITLYYRDTLVVSIHQFLIFRY
jgi:hypothetical protein